MDKAKIEDFCSAPAELFQVHSLHLISTRMLCRTSGAFTAPHLYRETPSASGAMNAPEVKKCCYATKHYQCRMSYLYGFNYIL